MASVLVEVLCPSHGLERFEIKVIKKYNVDPDLIEPKYRRRPKPGLSRVVVGRNVGLPEVKDYLVRYFQEIGLIESVISMKFRV
ncbi:MAG: hypothetical protein QXR45_06325 [Candidatus Bathyarchaeia archaeon]